MDHVKLRFQTSVCAVTLSDIQNLHLVISSAGVISVPDAVPDEFEDSVKTIRRPVAKLLHTGEYDFLLVDGFPDETKDVQNAIASSDRSASVFSVKDINMSIVILSSSQLKNG